MSLEQKQFQHGYKLMPGVKQVQAPMPYFSAAMSSGDCGI